MFFKNLKNKLLYFFLTLIIIPQTTFAYSEYIIASGENIGIELKASHVLVVGTYKINNLDLANNANIKVGDKLLKANNQEISSIENLISIINQNNKDEIHLEYQRGSKQLTTTLPLIKDSNNVYKTGLYVKDSITGVGTLTYIDPNTKYFGALGHEILEKVTNQKLEIKDGKIYSSSVTGITRSQNGLPGEKNASYNTNQIYGRINENTISGIFGTYTKEINKDKLYKVGKKEDIKLGSAKIMTVLKENNVEYYDISILKTTNNNDNKNILFEITDETLLEKTGGIIQGMSGSPIIQNELIIGAVTHVVVSDPTKGYAIFITKMLEEGEN